MASYKARPVIDEVVEQHKQNNIEMYNQIGSLPMYNKNATTSYETIKFDTMSVQNPISLLSELKNSTRALRLDAPTGTVDVTIPGAESSVERPALIIAFFKNCIISQYSSCEDFGATIAEFVQQAVMQGETINLPITTSRQSKIAKIISKELNDFYKELLDECGVKYYEVLGSENKSETKSRKKSNINDMVKAARSVSE